MASISFEMGDNPKDTWKLSLSCSYLRKYLKNVNGNACIEEDGDLTYLYCSYASVIEQLNRLEHPTARVS